MWRVSYQTVISPWTMSACGMGILHNPPAHVLYGMLCSGAFRASPHSKAAPVREVTLLLLSPRTPPGSSFMFAAPGPRAALQGILQRSREREVRRGGSVHTARFVDAIERTKVLYKCRQFEPSFMRGRSSVILGGSIGIGEGPKLSGGVGPDAGGQSLVVGGNAESSGLIGL